MAIGEYMYRPVSFWSAMQNTSSAEFRRKCEDYTVGCMYPSDPSKSHSHFVIQRMNIDCIFRDNSTD